VLPHIHSAGRGPRVLLVQGTGIAGRAWSPQVEALSDAFELAWYDAPGMGDRPGSPGSVPDMAADARAVLDDLGWESAFVVGHSLGGVIAQQLALDAPARVRGLLLLCTFAQGRAALSLRPTTMWIQTRTSLGTAAMRRRAFYQLVSHPALPVDEAHMAAIEEVFGRPLHALPPAAMAQVWALIRTDLSEHLGALDVPAVVISARHDLVAPPAQGRKLAEALGCPFEELDGGHALPIQQADLLNERLRVHLAGWAAG
jgi:pimeloyl-ACP methyl ester carboxylesterase